MADADRESEFARLFQDCHRQLFAYVHVLVRNYTDAEDVVQQTSLVLWRKFGEYQPGTSFAAWACGVGRFEALDFPQAAPPLSPPASPRPSSSGWPRRWLHAAKMTKRTQALEDCVEQLPESQPATCCGVVSAARRAWPTWPGGSGRTTHSVQSFPAEHPPEIAGFRRSINRRVRQVRPMSRLDEHRWSSKPCWRRPAARTPRRNIAGAGAAGVRPASMRLLVDYVQIDAEWGGWCAAVQRGRVPGARSSRAAFRRGGPAEAGTTSGNVGGLAGVRFSPAWAWAVSLAAGTEQ